MLNFDQKHWRIEVAQELLNKVNNDIELLKCIRSDETWVYGDVKNKA